MSVLLYSFLIYLALMSVVIYQVVARFERHTRNSILIAFTSLCPTDLHLLQLCQETKILASTSTTTICNQRCN